MQTKEKKTDNELPELGEHSIEDLLRNEIRIKTSLDEARKAAKKAAQQKNL